MEFKRETLDNGLDIIAEINPDTYSAAIGFFVRAGSRDETDEIAGASHFLEHMLFKGTPRRTAEDVNRELDEMGGYSNAFTTEEMTVYFAAVLPELQTRAVDLLTDILRPSLRNTDFETEKKVVLEEIKMYEDQPPFGVDEKCRELFFEGHPLFRSVLGTPDSVGGLTVERMREYFSRRYSPGSIVAVACGNLDFDRFVSDINERCGKWKPEDAPRELWRPVGKPGKKVYVRPSAIQEYVFLLSDAPCVRDEDRYAAAILANVMGDDVGSRLFWELVDNGRADCASLGFCDFLDAGYFSTTLCCSPETAAENVQVIRNIFDGVMADGIGEDELDRAKNKLLSRLVVSSERARGRLFYVGNEWLQTGEYFPIQADIEIVKSMTVDKIASMIKKYTLVPKLAVAVGPCEDI